MFPKAAKMSILGQDTMKLLNRSLVYTGLLSGTAAAVFVIFPELVGTIFGKNYLEAASIAGVYVVAMAVFSLTWIAFRILRPPRISPHPPSLRQNSASIRSRRFLRRYWTPLKGPPPSSSAVNATIRSRFGLNPSSLYWIRLG